MGYLRDRLESLRPLYAEKKAQKDHVAELIEKEVFRLCDELTDQYVANVNGDTIELVGKIFVKVSWDGQFWYTVNRHKALPQREAFDLLAVEILKNEYLSFGRD